jgi:hypothetical protein
VAQSAGIAQATQDVFALDVVCECSKPWGHGGRRSSSGYGDIERFAE